ncbi:sugar phosphate isomerase/epimerase [Arcicella sp. LKC2W]|uniref:sugar phosphate isomerase/epimerase family protein n=1 Tax=Arcicella sp. LKC2W TaxID=2984198 RepID=UPI002B219CD0|nr:sugar phosphate isomerase/epimerase [Arcicella sp. LKC2W]MEA5459893.1 sugar phosphate isomerase/epimerase [Arcicella sp. LKC2W]
MSEISRRNFLYQAGLLASASLISLDGFSKVPKLQLAYSGITWGGKDLDAMKDIASLGFKGVQLRANSYDTYKTKVSELKDQIMANGLALPMFSSGNVEIDPAKEQSTIDYHVAHASFVKALGGTSIQLTNSLRKNGVPPTTEQLKRLTFVMNEIGKQTADLGIQSTYHNHMNQFGETPEEVDAIVQDMNPKYLRLLLDVAHYHQGGGNPAKAVLDYKDIIEALHIKDVQAPLPEKPDDKKAYKFVELGQGNVDLKGVFDNLQKINFKKWAIVELDGVPVKTRTPKESGEISKAFLRDKIGFKFAV